MAKRGFTLVELMVVLAIAALLLVVAAPSLMHAMPGATLKAAASDVAMGLRRTQSQAIVANADRHFVVDVDRRRATIGEDAKPLKLPPDVHLSLFIGHTEVAGAASGGIRFFSDGSSTGGRVTLSQNGIAYDVRVDWLTGRVTTEGPHAVAP